MTSCISDDVDSLQCERGIQERLYFLNPDSPFYPVDANKVDANNAKLEGYGGDVGL